MLEVAARVYYARSRENLEALRAHKRAPLKQDLILADLIRETDNHRLAFEFVPGAAGTLVGAPVRISSQGLRDREFSPNPPPGVFRIAGIGDSVCFGRGVPPEETYLKVLETQLKRYAGGERYEVMNFGIPGHNTATELEVFRTRALPFQPDAAILQYCANDAELPNFVSTSPRPWSLRESFLRRFAREKVAAIWKRRTGPPGGLQSVSLEERQKGDIPPHVPAEYRELVGEANRDRAMRRFVELARDRDVALTIIPATYHYEMLRKTGTSPDDPAYTWLFDLAHSEDVPIVDPAVDAMPFLKRHNLPVVQPAGCAASIHLWVSPTDSHPNAPHHILMAKSLFRVLVREKIIPDAEAWAPRLDEMLAEFERMAEEAYTREQGRI